jgi:hypothetical protein
MIFLLEAKRQEPGTRNQEQRRVSASLKLAPFIQITDNRQLITEKFLLLTLVYILILPLINRFLHAVIATTNRPFVSHVRNDEVLWANYCYNY